MNSGSDMADYMRSAAKKTLIGDGLGGVGGGGEQAARFAHKLLNKLLEYVERATFNMQAVKESARFSRKSSFRLSRQDVKFFTKVVLPLIEKYFQSHRAYFLVRATPKEKEMTCNLFCRLSHLVRRKLACFGSDTNTAVRCLQVLVRAVDVSSVIKNGQDMVRASLLPLFSNAGDDLESVLDDLRHQRLSNLKGTSQKQSAHLDYVNMVLLPVLASLFDHLGANQYGADVLVGEIQLACYRILNGLWQLGTQGSSTLLAAEREWITNELHRHRPLIGECLGSFSSAFPIAYLEPQYNVNNKHSIMYGLDGGSSLSERSLEGQDVMNRLAKSLPSLHALIDEIGSMRRYEEAPHIVECLLPTVCAYLTTWWPHGLAATAAAAAGSTTASSQQQQQQQDIGKGKSRLEKSKSMDAGRAESVGAATTSKMKKMPSNETMMGAAAATMSDHGMPVTDVTPVLMDRLLDYILKLISDNVDEKEAAWMNRIASKS